MALDAGRSRLRTTTRHVPAGTPFPCCSLRAYEGLVIGPVRRYFNSKWTYHLMRLAACDYGTKESASAAAKT